MLERWEMHMKEMTEGRKYHFIPLKPKNKFKGACLLLSGVHMDFFLTLDSPNWMSDSPRTGPEGGGGAGGRLGG